MHVHYIGLLLLLCALSSHQIVFNRTFGLRAGDKTKNATRIEKKQGVLDRLSKIGAVPKIPPVPTDASKRIVPQKDSDKFDICKTQQPCANNGICTAEGNSFYCECPRSFYGKTCELVADERECANNLCENNSTCYSIDVEQEAFSVLHKNMSLRIKYKCWCKLGTNGDFCDYTEEMRACSEDQCNHHGIINLKTFKNGTECKCECEEHYSGEHCENVSPCRDFECINKGVCNINSTGRAYCECPTSLYLSPSAKVYGDHCESISLPDVVSPNECRPCLSNFVDFINCLKSKGIDKSAISYWWQACDVYISNCFDDHLSRLNCFNDGRCVVAAENVTSSGSDFTLAIPRCECQSDFEGMFCERRIPNLCENLSEDDKCVYGECAYNSTSLVTYCICDPGYYGLKCEYKRPCTTHSCGDAMCVELPVSDQSENKFPVCVCNSDQIVDNRTLRCTNPIFEACRDTTGVPKCKNNAYCYPCLFDNDKNSIMNACDDKEWNQGFRCICPLGFAPPTCDRKLGPCDTNRCMNNAKCQPFSNDTLDYKCICPKGYHGSFCEVSEGTCSRLGHICKNGACVDSVIFRRGFYCKCNNGFSGVDCDQEKQTTIFDTFKAYFAWSYPCTLFLFLTLVLIISTAVKEIYTRWEKKSQNSSPQLENA